MPFKNPSLIFYFKPVIIQTGYNNLLSICECKKLWLINIYPSRKLIKQYLICEVSLHSQMILSDISHVLMEFCTIPSNFSILLFRSLSLHYQHSLGQDIPISLHLTQHLPYRRHSIRGNTMTGKANQTALSIAGGAELRLQPFFRPAALARVGYLSFPGTSLYICKVGGGSWFSQCSVEPWGSSQVPWRLQQGEKDGWKGGWERNSGLQASCPVLTQGSSRLFSTYS